MAQSVLFISIPQAMRDEQLDAFGVEQFSPSYHWLATKLGETKWFIGACGDGDHTGKGPHLVALQASLLELDAARNALEPIVAGFETALDGGISRDALLLSMLKLDVVLSRRLLREVDEVLVSSWRLAETTKTIWQAEVDELLNFERQLDHYRTQLPHYPSTAEWWAVGRAAIIRRLRLPQESLR